MKHYLKSEDGEFKFSVNMYCGHPNVKDGTNEGLGCKGVCGECEYGLATMTIAECKELMRRAQCLALS